MREGRRILDADTHQMEPGDMWERHIAPRFRSQVPRVERVGNRQTVVVEGESLTNEGKYPFSTPEFLAALLKGMQRFERARTSAFDAASRLQDMDEAGVDAQI